MLSLVITCYNHRLHLSVDALVGLPGPFFRGPCQSAWRPSAPDLHGSRYARTSWQPGTRYTSLPARAVFFWPFWTWWGARVMNFGDLFLWLNGIDMELLCFVIAFCSDLAICLLAWTPWTMKTTSILIYHKSNGEWSYVMFCLPTYD